MPDYQCIKYELDQRVATVTLNRPEAANGLNLEMATELADIAKLIVDNDEIKAVLLTGEGRFFCAGGDVKVMAESDEPGAAVGAIAEQLHKAIGLFAEMRAPLICAVNGTAAGAGFSMAVCADMVIAAESAKFTMAYSNIGLSPDGSASYYLPRLIGLRKTQELMYTNRVLSAAESLEWGLVNQVVENEALMSVAQNLATKLAQGSLASNAAIKHLLISSDGNTLNQQLDIEKNTISQCADGVDGREGVASFVDKRKPVFE